MHKLMRMNLLDFVKKIRRIGCDIICDASNSVFCMIVIYPTTCSLCVNSTFIIKSKRPIIEFSFSHLVPFIQSYYILFPFLLILLIQGYCSNSFAQRYNVLFLKFIECESCKSISVNVCGLTMSVKILIFILIFLKYSF